MSVPDTGTVAAVEGIQLQGRYRDAVRSGDAAGFLVRSKGLYDGVGIGIERYSRESVIGRRVAAPLASWWREGSLWDKVRNFRPGQLVSAWLLLRTWVTLKFSRSESRWQLFNPRNDTRPMPSACRGRADD